MPITDPLVLPPDVMIIPVADLAPDTRARLPAGDAPFALTRPSVRSPSKLVDLRAASLLERFRTPTRIVDAIAGHSRAAALDPEAALDAAFPLLRDCFNARFLVPAHSAAATDIMPMHRRGDSVGRWRIRRLMRVYDEGELYHVAGPTGRAGVLKLLRPDSDPSLRGAFEREIMALRHLAGRGAPELLDHGYDHGEPWFIMTWCEGVSPLVAAAGIRDSARGDRAPRLLGLGRAIVESYHRLHGAGVIHADVHPHNVLVGRDHSVTLIDFGWSQVRGAEPPPDRAGVAYFMEPEWAGARRRRRPPPPPTMAGEQYSVGALLYLIMTGDHYLDFRLERDTMLRQITGHPPLPFSARGVPPWPALEAALGRALTKDPAGRFASMADFGAALDRIASEIVPATATPGLATDSSLAAAADRVRARFGPCVDPHQATLAAPTSSLSHGAVGLAYACYRLACLERDPAWLGQADCWLERARARRLEPDAFVGLEHAAIAGADDSTPHSPYHGADGMHAVRALVRQAQGDPAGMARAVRRFLDHPRSTRGSPDLATGRTGSVMAAALLLAATPPDQEDLRAELVASGNNQAESIWKQVSGEGPLAAGGGLLATSGMAHGWAGVLYGQLRWSLAAGREPPAGVDGRLTELADLAVPAGRGRRWPWRLGEAAGHGAAAMPGWCNGSAGFVHLWLVAHRVGGRREHLDLAAAAGWDVWDDPALQPTLCCGLAGRVYALLALYRQTGDGAWLERAHILGGRAVAGRWPENDAPIGHSLYKGETGLALMAADLAHPEDASMPFFEPEGWPHPGA